MNLKEQLHKIYGKLGPGGRSLASFVYSSIPLRFRKKKGFWKYLDFLRSTQWQSSEWHFDFQKEQLKALLHTAANSTDYYRQLFKQNRLDPKAMETLECLRQIPILQKETLVERLNDFLPSNFPKNQLISNSTSGSTSEPFKFKQDYYAVMREEAFSVRHWENAGMTFGEPSICLRSFIPENAGQNHLFDRVNNRHYFSAYNLDEKNIKSYFEKITKLGADFIFGYPSSLEIFSDYLLETGRILKFKAAVTGSEMLSSNARIKIESALNTKVFDWYGLAEPTVTMGQCKQGNYHVFSEYGYLELLNAGDHPVTRQGEVGRIVGTNFTNFALPLIRYDTKDLGVFTNQKCDCGRGTPVMISSIRGRKDDLLIGADGQFLPSVNFYSLFAKMGGEIKRFQLIQNDRNKFCLRLIRGPEFSETTINKIVEGLNRRIGGRPQFNIETVEKIAPSKSGKIRGVVREFKLAPEEKVIFDEN